MIYNILTDDTPKIIHYSAVYTANDPKTPNLQLDTLHGEVDSYFFLDSSGDLTTISFSVQEDQKSKETTHCFKTWRFGGEDFLIDSKETGECSWAQIVGSIQQHNHNTKTEPKHIKFWCSMNNGR